MAKWAVGFGVVVALIGAWMLAKASGLAGSGGYGPTHEMMAQSRRWRRGGWALVLVGAAAEIVAAFLAAD